ncbi:pyridoxal phosphate-dependent transferase, partial [Pavlovales sp. CCMP2436]
MSPLVASVVPSKSVAIFSQTSEMKSRGEQVRVNAALCVGQPDFPPPQAVIEATAEAAVKGLTTYTSLLGTLELRTAICSYLERKKGTKYAPEEILVAGGGKQAIYEAMVALCQPGDEVIIPAPYYTSYPDIVILAGATPVILPTTAGEGYVPTCSALEELLNERTRMLILCNPCNPTGAVIPQARLEEMAEILRRPEFAHVLVLSDEICKPL